MQSIIYKNTPNQLGVFWWAVKDSPPEADAPQAQNHETNARALTQTGDLCPAPFSGAQWRDRTSDLSHVKGTLCL